MGDWILAPCSGCGVMIEDEGPAVDWWCSGCWPHEERRRLKERVAELEAACISLRDDLEETVGYAPGYFREKWDLGSSLKLPVVASLPTSGDKPEEPETCKWCDQPPAEGGNICTGHQKSHAAHSFKFACPHGAECVHKCVNSSYHTKEPK